ncbi:MAG: hypothetical protein F6K36_00975 [Symploca sp. SIO3C6]|nr:hypothetical protein [Symploca sp. SIO3C6]
MITESIAASNPSSKSLQSAESQRRWMRYLSLGIIMNAAIWGITLVHLEVSKPNYSSKWTYSLPGARSYTRINIPNLGAASSEVDSPYSDRSQDPREKYKFIAESRLVIEQSAAELDMGISEFGKPKIQAVDNTTMMNFEISGTSPQEAQSKAFALSKAFENRLEQLRIQEIQEENEPIKKAVESALSNLKAAERLLAQHKAKTGLSSAQQVSQVSENLENLRREEIQLSAQQQQTTASLQELSSNLDTSAKQVSDAFILKSDQLFQQHLQDYSEASSQLEILRPTYGPNHPAVVRESAKQKGAKAAILERSQSLLGRPMDLAKISELAVDSGERNGTARESLFRQIVEVQAQKQGLQASGKELTKHISQLENRFKTMTQDALTLQTLERDVRIAETVYSTAFTQLGTAQLAKSASYPKLELITQPSLPSQSAPVKQMRKMAFLGAIAASGLVSLGLFSLWLRPHWQRQRQTIKSNPTTSI